MESLCQNQDLIERDALFVGELFSLELELITGVDWFIEPAKDFLKSTGGG